MLCITHEITVCQSEFFSKLEFWKAVSPRLQKKEESSQSPSKSYMHHVIKVLATEETKKRPSSSFATHYSYASSDKNPWTFALSWVPRRVGNPYKILTFVVTSRLLWKPLVIHFCPLKILLNSWWFFLYCKIHRICKNSKEFIRGKKVQPKVFWK